MCGKLAADRRGGDRLRPLAAARRKRDHGNGDKTCIVDQSRSRLVKHSADVPRGPPGLADDRPTASQWPRRINLRENVAAGGTGPS
jgi:hypothetical protein